MTWCLRQVTLIVITLLVLSCSQASSDVPTPIEGAELVSLEDLNDDLRSLWDLRASDDLFLMEGPEGAVLIRVRVGQPTTILGTSCDVVTSVSLPERWEGSCSEYTWESRRVRGVFPHGTVSVEVGDVPLEATPEKAAAAAAALIFPTADFAPVGRVVNIPGGPIPDFRVEIDQHGFCQWFGVAGDGIGYRASPALSCEPPVSAD